MNTKFSVSKSIRIIVVLAGLVLAAIAGQSVLAKSDDRSQQARQPEVVHASLIELARQDISVLKVKNKQAEKLSSAAVRSEVKSEIQPADDKGGLNPRLDRTTTESGDKKGQPELQANDDKVQPELQPADDNGASNVNDDGANNDMEDQEQNDVEFVGILSAINGDTLTINGMTVVITPKTEVKGTLMVGETVKVEGVLQADKSVQAREIKVTTVGHNDQQEQKKTPAPTMTEDDHHSAATPTPVISDNHGGSANSGSSDDHGSSNRGGHDDGSSHH